VDMLMYCHHTAHACRRPNIALGDGYFPARYINETLAVDMEAELVSQLSSAVHRSAAEQIAIAHDAGCAAAAAGGNPAPGLWQAYWKAGMSSAVVYGGQMRGWASRSLWQEGAQVPGVGAAAAALPACIRDTVNRMADLHQIRDYVELSELRRIVLKSASVELGMLLKEEAHRVHASPPRPATDSHLR
jgi:hypothetical protein